MPDHRPMKNQPLYAGGDITGTPPAPADHVGGLTSIPLYQSLYCSSCGVELTANESGRCSLCWRRETSDA